MEKYFNDDQASGHQPTAEFHPVQIGDLGRRRHTSLPSLVTLRAYEVYCHLYRAQPAMITGGCRGGFGAGEIIAFLYARSFPKDEWQRRVDEALRRNPDDAPI